MTACVLQAAIEEIESGHTVKPSGISPPSAPRVRGGAGAETAQQTTLLRKRSIARPPPSGRRPRAWLTVAPCSPRNCAGWMPVALVETLTVARGSVIRWWKARGVWGWATIDAGH